MKSHARIAAIIITQLLLRSPESQALRLTSIGSLFEDLSPHVDSDDSFSSSSPLDNTMTVDSVNSYGVDRSFPIQHENLIVNDDDDGTILLFDNHERQLFYDNFMAGCKATEIGPDRGRCTQAEAERIETNFLQPSKMKNYTKLGYAKVAVPQKLEEQLTRFWKAQEDYLRLPTKANVEVGSTYFNHWESNQYVMNIDDDKFRSKHLRSLVWDETKPILEGWAGTELTPSSLLGVQVFTNKSVMPHRVDTLPFVINAIIHVADDLYTPWPIEVYSHDGKAHNVTLGVGEMLLYEGTSVIVGRPYPLRGNFNAEISISFEPMGYSRQHYRQDDESSLAALYLKSLRSKKIDLVYKELVPSYIERDSEEYNRWRQNYPKARLVSHSLFVQNDFQE